MSTSSELWRRLRPVLGFATVQAIALALAAALALTLYGPWARGARAAASSSEPQAVEAAAAARVNPSRIAACSEELRRHAGDLPGHRARVRQQLFEGRCAGHPDAYDGLAVSRDGRTTADAAFPD